jgi:atypical dual specificity phosphatase
MSHLSEETKWYDQQIKKIGIIPISKITSQIYLGSIASTYPRVLVHYGITHIINAAKEANYRSNPPQIRLMMDDIPEENLFRVLEPSRRTMVKILENPNNKILVHCTAGVSRSTSVLIYYFMKEKGMTFEEALDMVRSKRNIVNPNKGFVKTLKAVEDIKV